MAIFRSTIKPVPRTRNGKVYWIARGTYPERQRDGSVKRKRHEEGLPASMNQRDRQDFCDRLNKAKEDRALLVTKPMTFNEALDVYINIGHEKPLFDKAIRHEIGHMMCSDIDDEVMTKVTKKIITKKGASPSYINRHLYTPVVATLRLAAKSKACSPPMLTRPVGHKRIKPVSIPEDVRWYGQVVEFMSPATVAFFLAQSVHGRRTREWLSRVPSDFNESANSLFLGRTKNGDHIELELHPEVVLAIKRIPDWKTNKWLFNCGPGNPSRMRTAIKRACIKAEQPYFTPHTFGRHAAVSRALRSGKSVKWTAEMYGMTEEMVNKRYGHLVKKDTAKSVHEVGQVVVDQVVGDTVGKEKLLIIDATKNDDNALKNNDRKEGIN